MKSILTLGSGSLSGYASLNGFGDIERLSTKEQAVTQLLQAVSRSYSDVWSLIAVQSAKTVSDASVSAVQKTASAQLVSAEALRSDAVGMLSKLILSGSTPGAGMAIQAYLAELFGIEASVEQIFEGAKGMVAAEKALMNAAVSNWKKNIDVSPTAARKALSPAQQFSSLMTYHLSAIAWAAKVIWGGEEPQSEGQQYVAEHKNNVYSVISTLSKGIDPGKAGSLYQSAEGLHSATNSIATVMTSAKEKAYAVLRAKEMAKVGLLPDASGSTSAATAAASKAAADAKAQGATAEQQQQAAAQAYIDAGGTMAVSPQASPTSGISTPVMVGVGVALLGATFFGVRALKKAKAAKATGVGCLECGL
jgi:hypothetical protein